MLQKTAPSEAGGLGGRQRSGAEFSPRRLLWFPGERVIKLSLPPIVPNAEALWE
jgi:hypothetical protein